MTFKLTLSTLLMTGVVANAQVPALKDVFRGYFHVGAALNQAQFEERDARGAAIVREQFDTISPENVLKWEAVHPRPDVYAFDAPDRYVAFGEKHHMFIIGHTLVWHNQVPRWVFQNDKGEPLDRDALLKRMHDHIQTVVGRYKGRIGGWDVVNEALNEDGTLRQSPWLKIIGEDYLVKAFEYAHEADPKAELYYNDYSVENPAKRNGAVELIKKLQAAGVTVTAIGLQGHDKMERPTIEQQEATIVAFKNLGIKVNITELDVDVLPRCLATKHGGRQSQRTGAGQTQSVYRRAAGRGAAGAGAPLRRSVRGLLQVPRHHLADHFLGRHGWRLLAEQLAGSRKNQLSAAVRSPGSTQARVSGRRSHRAERKHAVKTLLLGLCLTAGAFALGQTRYVETVNAGGSFPLVQSKIAAAIYVDSGDHAGVVRAAGDLVADIARVTGSTPAPVHDDKGLGANAVIAGTIGKSALIDRLIREGKIDASGITGKWEAFLIQVVDQAAARRRQRAGDRRQRQARHHLRHLRSLRTDRRFALVFLGGRSRGPQGRPVREGRQVRAKASPR